MEKIYDFKAFTSRGKELDFSDFRGRLRLKIIGKFISKIIF